ncbi:MAG: exodeoxyribonuclease V subunit gamma [Victivallales bacterium]|nr:exodeoxyribonuclease V subunit gamma [Victivallales bacterium]
MFKLFREFTLDALAEKFRQCMEGQGVPGILDLEPVTVINQTRGISDWLRLHLAQHGEGGIAMNLDMMLPTQFMQSTLDRIYKLDRRNIPCEQSLRWRIFAELAMANLGDYPQLDKFLNCGDRLLKAWQLSGKVAGLYDRYHLSWSQLIQHWKNSDPAATRNTDEQWLHRLFRKCFPEPQLRYEEYLHQFLEDASISPAAVEGWRGGTIHVFGVGAMRSSWFRFLLKLGELDFFNVNFFWLTPSKEYIGYEFSKKEQQKNGGDVTLPDDEGNMVFRNNCRQLRLFFNTVEESMGDQFDYDSGDTSLVDEIPESESALQRLQREIRTLVPREEGEAAENDGDDSIRIHACHSIRRQVEVLHDQLCLAFDQDPGLKPSDVLVMAPDINAYAPYIQSVFSEHDNLAWRISICDRTPLSSSAVITALFDILETVQSQCAAEDVYELLELTVIQNNYGFSHGQLPVIRNWIKKSGIRWGIDGEHHQETIKANFREFSWKYGLQRLMMGLCRSGSDALDEDGIPQMANVDSNRELLFAFSAFVNDFMELREQIQGEKTFQAWCELLIKFMDTFLRVAKDDDQGREESTALRRAITNLAGFAQESPMPDETPIPLNVVLEMLKEHFTAPGNAHNFISDKLTFCSMCPMRSVPKRIIAVLGMNEKDFPKREPRMNFDISARIFNAQLPPRTDNYSKADEDRFLFLETILAAKEKLWFFYNGCTSFNEDKLPCAAPLAELIEYLDHEKSIIRHPRHSFSPDYFRSGSGLAGKSASISAYNIAVKMENQETLSPSAGTDLPKFDLAEIPDVISLQEVITWLSDPCVAFAKQHYGVDYAKQYNDGIKSRELLPEDFEGESNDARNNWREVMRQCLRHPDFLQEIYQSKVAKLLSAECLLPVNQNAQNDILKKILPASSPTTLALLAQAAECRLIVTADIEVKHEKQNVNKQGVQIVHHILRANDDSGKPHYFVTVTSGKDKWKHHVQCIAPLTFLRCAEQNKDAELHIITMQKTSITMVDIPIHPIHSVSDDENLNQNALRKLIRRFLLGRITPIPFFPKTTAEVYKNPSALDEAAYTKFTDKPGTSFTAGKSSEKQDNTSRAVPECHEKAVRTCGFADDRGSFGKYYTEMLTAMCDVVTDANELNKLNHALLQATAELEAANSEENM